MVLVINGKRCPLDIRNEITTWCRNFQLLKMLTPSFLKFCHLSLMRIRHSIVDQMISSVLFSAADLPKYVQYFYPRVSRQNPSYRGSFICVEWSVKHRQNPLSTFAFSSSWINTPFPTIESFGWDTEIFQFNKKSQKNEASRSIIGKGWSKSKRQIFYM